MCRLNESSLRSARGQVIAESAVALFVMFIVFVGSILLLLNVGCVIYYKMKLAMVTTQTAGYAASIATPSSLTWLHNQNVGANFAGLSAQATQYANTALKNMGLNGNTANPPAVTVVYGPLAGDVWWANVFITVPQVPLVGDGSIVPYRMDLSDSACAMARYDQVPVPNQFILPGETPATPGGQDASLYMGGYGWVAGGAAGMPPYDQQNLRSSYFSPAPTIIKMGVPTGGKLSEYWDAGGPTMTVLPGGTTNY